MIHPIEEETVKVRHIAGRMERENLSFPLLIDLRSIGEAPHHYDTISGPITFTYENGFAREIFDN